ncbi:MAG: TadE/TadG family type IV pilus assembly protein [Desulfobacca sp.]|nr:TadE/TadG family type IV pilus assembly protein [Desulfobacca sp.]
MIRLLRDRQGNISVEFALVLPILLALLAGIVDFGHAYWVKHVLSAGVREGARVGSRYKASEVNLYLVKNKVREYVLAGGVDTTNLTVTAEVVPTTGPSGWYNDKRIEVTASLPFQFFMVPNVMASFISDPDNPDPPTIPSQTTLSATAKMLFERL